MIDKPADTLERYLERHRSHARPWPDPRAVRLTLDDLGVGSWSEMADKAEKLERGQR
jgi:hypothetical protein